MVSIEYNFIFVHIPKTAGNAFQNILRNYSEDKVVCLAPHQDGVERFELDSCYGGATKHSSLAVYKEKTDPVFFQNAYKFTCVRNPWDRLISFYFSPHRGVSHWDRQEFIQFVSKVPSSFSYLRLANESLKDCLSHFDFIVRFEALEKGFEEVCVALGIPDTKLPVRNKASKKYYTEYYDQELIDLVADLFADEIEVFGYTYEA